MFNSDPGSVSATSYASVVEGNAYHDAHLYGSAWSSAKTDTKERALMMATRILDERVNWVGRKATDAQALRWPRSSVVDADGYTVSSTVVPVTIKNAVIEFARLLIDTDTTAARDDEGVKSMKLDSLAIEYDKTDQKNAIPQTVREMVADYGVAPARGGVKFMDVIRA